MYSFTSSDLEQEGCSPILDVRRPPIPSHATATGVVAAPEVPIPSHATGAVAAPEVRTGVRVVETVATELSLEEDDWVREDDWVTVVVATEPEAEPNTDLAIAVPRRTVGSLVIGAPYQLVQQPTLNQLIIFNRSMGILNTRGTSYSHYASIMGPTTEDAEWGTRFWWGILHHLLPRYNQQPPRRGLLGPIQFAGWFAKPVPFSENQAQMHADTDDLRFETRTWYPAVFSLWADGEYFVDADGYIVPIEGARMACLNILWLRTRAWWVHYSRVRNAVLIDFRRQ